VDRTFHNLLICNYNNCWLWSTEISFNLRWTSFITVLKNEDWLVWLIVEERDLIETKENTMKILFRFVEKIHWKRKQFVWIRLPNEILLIDSNWSSETYHWNCFYYSIVKKDFVLFAQKWLMEWRWRIQSETYKNHS